MSDIATPTTSPPAVEIVEPPAPSVTRSPADLLRLVVAVAVLLVVLLVQWLFGNTLTTFTADLFAGLSAVPDWMITTLVVGTRILAVALLAAGLVVSLRHGRWRLLLTVGLAGALAAILVALFDTFAPGSEEAVVELQDGLGQLTDEGFPTSAGIGIASAMLTAAAPWLSRGWRRWGWVLVMGLMLTRFIAAPISFDSFRAVLIGWVVGAAVLVALGGPARRPTGQAIATGLAAVGAPLSRLERADVDARGSAPYFGVAADGRRLFVKALGQDQRSADLLFRIYRSVHRRRLGDERAFSTLRRAVEHEALVALAARDVGILTPRLVAFATAEPNGFVLAYEAIEGRSLDRLAPEEVSDELLDAVWQRVVQQRRHRIAHRDLRLANIFVADDGEVWMIDYGFSELAASDLLLTTDVAELLASSAPTVGPPRAVARAKAALGAPALASALERLHPWALGGATRTALGARPGLLDELRREVQAASAAGGQALSR